MVLEEIRKNKMGTPNVVKPQQPKPEPVAISTPDSGPENKTAVEAKTAEQPAPAVKNEVAPVAEKPPPAEPEPVIEEETAKEKEEDSKPGIMQDSDTLANVVVSDSQGLPDADEDVDNEDDLEDTTERAILKEEVVLNDKEPQDEEAIRDEEDYQAGDPDRDLEQVREPLYDTSSDKQEYDEEATQVSDLSLKNPLPLGKPQMAESRKVKNKRKKFGLFNMFKKSKE
jgi:hypothetical protein